ncbi:MAG: hypothetical protein PHT40_00975 [Patescibacteria group bacterium]|nr:hypothetical protein [Patescibacteria group bacterium]
MESETLWKQAHRLSILCEAMDTELAMWKRRNHQAVIKNIQDTFAVETFDNDTIYYMTRRIDFEILAKQK